MPFSCLPIVSDKFAWKSCLHMIGTWSAIVCREVHDSCLASEFSSTPLNCALKTPAQNRPGVMEAAVQYRRRALVAVPEGVEGGVIYAYILQGD